MKSIKIDEDVYHLLQGEQRPRETISQVINRLLQVATHVRVAASQLERRQ